MCLRPRAVESVVKAGIGVETSLCAACPSRGTCAYQKQINSLRYRKGRLIIGTHEHLFLNTIPTGIDLLVVDESVVMKATVTHRFITTRILECLPAQGNADSERKILQAVQEVFATSERGQFLMRLRTACTKREIISARRFLEMTPSEAQVHINGGMSDAQIIEILGSTESLIEPIVALLRQIEREWESVRHDFNSIETLALVEGRQIVVQALKPPLLSRGTPTLLLDGTATLSCKK